MLRKLLCLAGQHNRLGRAVMWDGRDFRSVCRHCSQPMVKRGNIRWRAVGRHSDVLLLDYKADDVSPWPEEWHATPG